MPDAWYAFLSTLCARTYFSRIRVVGRERLPRRGPLLYAGLHRNGAVDGFVYKSIVRRAVFLIAAQLQKNLLSQIFFTGIPVVRDKDSGDRTMNAEALERCQQLLAKGGELFVFPEGTSALGPQHLPFKSGASRIAVEAWRQGIPLRVVPLGIHYHALSTFRSSVEVIVGEPIGPEPIAKLTAEDQLAEVKKSLTLALERVGINVESEEYFAEMSSIASMATSRGQHFDALKSCEKGIPARLEAKWQELRGALQSSEIVRSQAATSFSSASPWVSFLGGIGLVPFVGVAAILNVGPLIAGYWAGRKLADERNVIALWRILVGVPLFFVWFVAVFAGLAFAGRGWWLLVFLLLTVIGWLAYQPARQLVITGWNGIRQPLLRQKYLAFQNVLFEELGSHGS